MLMVSYIMKVMLFLFVIINVPASCSYLDNTFGQVDQILNSNNGSYYPIKSWSLLSADERKEQESLPEFIQPSFFPRTLDINSEGEVYVTYAEEGVVKIYDNNGTCLDSWIPNPPDDLFGNFAREIGFSIAVDSTDNTYLTETNVGYVLKFDNNGTFLTAFGLNRGEAYEPMDIAIDSADNLYVLDNFGGMEKYGNRENHTVRFDAADIAEQYWQSSIVLFEPRNIAVDHSGSIYLTGQLYPPGLWAYIQKYSDNGTLLNSWDLHDHPTWLEDISEGRDGDMYFISGESIDDSNGTPHDYSFISRLDRTGNLNTILDLGKFEKSFGYKPFPSAMDVDWKDDIYIIDQNSILTIFSSRGQPLIEGSNVTLGRYSECP